MKVTGNHKRQRKIMEKQHESYGSETMHIVDRVINEVRLHVKSVVMRAKCMGEGKYITVFFEVGRMKVHKRLRKHKRRK